MHAYVYYINFKILATYWQDVIITGYVWRSMHGKLTTILLDIQFQQFNRRIFIISTLIMTNAHLNIYRYTCVQPQVNAGATCRLGKDNAL